MKIDLDLSDIYQDEESYGLQPEFIGQVVSAVANQITRHLKQDVNRKIEEAVTTKINEAVGPVIQQVILNLVDFEFEPTTSWGSKDKPTTVRNQILKRIQEETKYEKKNSYGSSETALTKILSDVLREETRPFVQEIGKTINYQFKKECIAHAQKQLEAVLRK